jgi:hypothetical protein
MHFRSWGKLLFNGNGPKWPIMFSLGICICKLNFNFLQT